jgi:hypothetical protein
MAGHPIPVPARVVQLAISGYLAALIATIAGLIVFPFSNLLMFTLLALFGLFLVAAIVVLAYATGVIISRSWKYGVLLHIKSRVMSVRINRSSRASNPGCLQLSQVRVKQLLPELFMSSWNPMVWLDRLVGSQATLLFQMNDHLQNGDSRAAIVLSSAPLLVAAYTDELDCIALLRFPDELAQEYGLQPRARLLTVNRYALGESLAPDLENGPLSFKRFVNYHPIVADFVSDDIDGLRERKRAIREDEWTRTWILGQRYLEKHGPAARDGRPFMSLRPAEIVSGG